MKGTFYIGFGDYRAYAGRHSDSNYVKTFWYSKKIFTIKKSILNNGYENNPFRRFSLYVEKSKQDKRKDIKELNEMNIAELEDRNLIAPIGTVLRITLGK